MGLFSQVDTWTLTWIALLLICMLPLITSFLVRRTSGEEKVSPVPIASTPFTKILIEALGAPPFVISKGSSRDKSTTSLIRWSCEEVSPRTDCSQCCLGRNILVASELNGIVKLTPLSEVPTSSFRYLLRQYGWPLRRLLLLPIGSKELETTYRLHSLGHSGELGPAPERPTVLNPARITIQPFSC